MAHCLLYFKEILIKIKVMQFHYIFRNYIIIVTNNTQFININIIRAARAGDEKKKRKNKVFEKVTNCCILILHSSSSIALERRKMANVANDGIMAEVNRMLEEMYGLVYCLKMYLLFRFRGSLESHSLWSTTTLASDVSKVT